jgi:hypothetical protein
MRRTLLAFALLALGACSQPANSQSAPGGHRVPLVELFTSQGCSSCPPADAVMQRLAGEPGVVVILRPVTYWDEGGWRDTLARPQNTAKQFAYSRALGVQAYTPQAVIDGRAALVGSQEASIRAALRAARDRVETAALTVTRGANGRAHITVNGAAGATVSLVGLAPSKQVAIGSGENGGATVPYVNVVRAEQMLGRAQTSSTFDAALESGPSRDASRWAVVVQDGDAGAVRAAAFVPNAP